MKKSILYAFVLSLIACNDAAEEKNQKSDSTAVSNEAVSYVSPVAYSSDFEIGNSKQAQIVVSLWKDFDDNNLQNGKEAFADSVTLELPGMRMQTTRDSAIAATTAYRSQYTSMTSTVEAVLPTKARNRGEDWVAIWGMEKKTDKAGKTDSVRIHEIWRFIKDGKIDYMAQFIQPQGGM